LAVDCYSEPPNGRADCPNSRLTRRFEAGRTRQDEVSDQAGRKWSTGRPLPAAARARLQAGTTSAVSPYRPQGLLHAVGRLPMARATRPQPVIGVLAHGRVPIAVQI